MAGWPSIDRAEDQRLARALDAGDTNAIAQLYAAYAERLFDYCHVLLRDQDSAAQAVHDSLIAVRERIAALPDPRLFRGWLYATTRADCLRRLSHGELPAERRRAPESGADGLDPATLEFLRAALAVLEPAQREALDLAIRHELDPHELSEVLGTTPQETSVLVEQARGDLDAAFAAVVVATTGRDNCPTVPALAGPPGERLDAERCGELAKHVAGCPICALHVNGAVATDRLLRAMPAAAAPADLRGRVLATAFSPEHAPTRATIAMRFEPPPPPAEPAPEKRRRTATPVWLVGGAAACAVLLLCGFLLVSSGSGGSNGERPAGSAAAASTPGGSPTDDGSMTSHAASATPTKSETPTPTPSATPSSATPTPTPTKSKHARTTAPTHHTRPPAGPPPTHPKPPSQSQPGRLVVSGCNMGYGYTCQITLYADGGPVTWAVVDTYRVSTGGSGNLAAGTSTSLSVSRGDRCGRGQGSVTFSSGAVAYISWRCGY
ncbi:RNA polymerase sigma factor [Actinoallomurus rhizosphaericola]|uniref:RNA polymerase sigma factor n=1 Tax=Actinoallomurus rhizosphaericola TaxID=2952536 RepID=UPI002092B7A5|nr:sigma-70 family RNA polymerase sigma factor [Actinoallomurus rhizosphaericola]MCO5998962.1 RNA polymerase sigma factor [Actinoallomurus rhizosphaericola]